MITVPEEKQIILFDGVCNLCNGLVQKIIRYDRKAVFRFVSIQSDLGKEILEHLQCERVDSIILWHPKKGYYIKSEAVLKITKVLSGRFALLQVLYMLPKFLRDKIYDYVARNRYSWFGQSESCLLPSKETESRFL
ncbi:MAG: hypothetical protein RLZZ500_1741 [Bacteroidota bacterium]|jgi:predicted DCC family thiol-disulfide oxidoreductase YuxK